jgi:hypothetical protein
MKKLILPLLLGHFALLINAQIVVDHDDVVLYDQIPQQYIDSVKSRWLSYAGESHSAALRDGLEQLEDSSATYAVSITTSGTPEGATTANLRASRGTWGNLTNATGWIYNYGEEDWFTSAPAIAQTKVGLSYCNTAGPHLDYFGFGWCWDQGTSGPDYIAATKEYIAYCADSIDTKVFFTTGTVDLYNEEANAAAYNSSVKYQLIRDSVDNSSSRALFDYADILCYNNEGELNTQTWDGNVFPIIHSDNVTPTETGHISNEGALRLAKAMWVFLAQLEGWEDNITSNESDLELISDVSIFMGSDFLRVQTSDVFDRGDVSLLDLSGRFLKTILIEGNTTEINTSTLTAGVYIVTVSKEAYRISKKVIVLM